MNFEPFTSDEGDVSVWVRSQSEEFSRGTLYMVDMRTGRAQVLLSAGGVRALEDVSMGQLYTNSIEQECTDGKKETSGKQISAHPIVERQIQKYPQFKDEITQMFIESDRKVATFDRFVFKNAMFLPGDVR